MRVAVADDSRHFRSGIEALLDCHEIHVVASVGDGASLLTAVAETAAVGAPPDVAVLDMRMPPTKTNEGLLTARALRAAYPDMAVLALSADDDAPYVADLFAGAPPQTGYLYKGTITERAVLRDALRRLRSARPVLDRRTASGMLLQAEQRDRRFLLPAHERAAVLGVLLDTPEEDPAVADADRGLRATLASVASRFGIHPGEDLRMALLTVLTADSGEC